MTLIMYLSLFFFFFSVDDEFICHDDGHTSGAAQEAEHQDLARPHSRLGSHLQHRYSHSSPSLLKASCTSSVHPDQWCDPPSPQPHNHVSNELSLPCIVFPLNPTPLKVTLPFSYTFPPIKPLNSSPPIPTSHVLRSSNI